MYEDVDISPKVKKAFENWKEDPLSFLTLHRSPNHGAPMCPAEHYAYTCGIEARRESDRILWRFLTSFYHKLISELESTPRRHFKGDGLLVVSTRICESTQGDPEVVRQNLSRWAGVGRRYHGISDALKSAGCFFLLPESISDWT